MTIDQLEEVLSVEGKKKEYVLYGAGLECAKFLYRMPDIQCRLAYCIDKSPRRWEMGFHVYHLEEAPDLNHHFIIIAAIFPTFIEIKQGLEARGLKEFHDFIWCYCIGKKVVLLNMNCHGPVLAKYLHYSQTFNDKFCFYPIPSIHENAKKRINKELLHACDIYLHQDIRADNSIGYELSDEYIIPLLRKESQMITVPNFVEMARWLFPQQGDVDSGAYIGDRHVFWEDRVLEDGYQKGMKALVEYRNLYNTYEISREEMQESFEKGIDKLRKRESNWDIKVVDFILSNFRQIPCFLDARHPSVYLMQYVSRKVADLLDCYDIWDDSGFCDDTIWTFFGIPLPLLECVRSYFGIHYQIAEDIGTCLIEDYYPILGAMHRRRITFDDYVSSYLWMLHGIRVK